MVDYRSVSQVKELDDCGYRYYLHREATDEDGNRLWERPAAWLPQGLGVHEAAEAWEKSGRTMTLEEAQKIFGESYDAHTNRLLETTPNLDFWFRSGPYGGDQDIPRRYEIGMEQTARYVRYYTEKHPEEKPLRLSEDEFAVEWPFEVKFGDVPVRGVIDFVLEDGKPRDNKTGNRPGDPFQLGTYAGVIEQLLDVKPTTGDFWMGKSGKPTIPIDLTDWTQQRLADVFGDADERIRNQQFDPDPDPDKCRFCPMAHACEYSVG